jgi:hypothetical protein
MDHCRTSGMTARGGFSDFVRLFRNDRAISVLLHAAIDGARDNHLVSGKHGILPTVYEVAPEYCGWATLPVIFAEDRTP